MEFNHHRKMYISIQDFKNRLSNMYWHDIRTSKIANSHWNKWCYAVKMAKTTDQIEHIYNSISKYLSMPNEEMRKYRLSEII